MPDEIFADNLLRMIAATLYNLLALQSAREMFGKSYYSLGVAERSTVDAAILQGVAGNYQTITPELLKNQVTQKPQAGFQPIADK